MPEPQYDRWGRMKYCPELHYNQGKSYTVSDLSYICKHYRRGEVLSLSLAVGRTDRSIRSLVDKLRKEDQFEYYKNLGV